LKNGNNDIRLTINNCRKPIRSALFVNLKSLIVNRYCLFLLFSFTCSSAHAFSDKQPFDISSDMIEYSDADQALTADGHTIVIQGSSTLKADSMRYERSTGRLFARGHVYLNDKGAILIGESMQYDMKAESGTVTNALGYSSPWLFSGTEWQKVQDYYIGRNASFTSCDLVDPHYHLKSSRVHMVPNEYFWAWNNLAYADTVPVFYSPFMFRSLGKRRVVMQLQPGHDDGKGNFLKTVTTLRMTDMIYDKVYFDHYSEAGNGIGNEFNYKVPGRIQGSLFGYYINPRGDPNLTGAPNEPQYNVRSYHWQKLDSYDTLQSNVNLRKNISFNNQFFPQDTNGSVSDITSSIAMTRQKGHLNQRLVVERTDSPDPGDTSPSATVHTQSASYPRYDATYYQVPIWKPASMNTPTPSVSSGTPFVLPPPAKPQIMGPLLLSANGSFGNTYLRTDDQYHPNGDGSFTLSEGLNLSRDWSFNPNVTPSVHWQDKADPNALTDNSGFQARLGTTDTLRWRPLSSFTLDTTYGLTARMEQDGTALDRSKPDGGIETHHVNWLAYWRPSRRTQLRSFSGYDLRRLADEDPNAYRQRRWNTWTTEYTYDPSMSMEYFFRYALDDAPIHVQLWEGDMTFYGPYKTLFREGFLYNKGNPERLTWNNTFGIYLSPGWRVDATLHALMPTSSVDAMLREGNLIDEEFIVTRDMHCWEASFIYRNIPPFTRQYSLLFNLKLGVAGQKEIANEDLETQYYPWRSRTYVH
jgi:lipopolysaccharide export system protein LptA